MEHLLFNLFGARTRRSASLVILVSHPVHAVLSLIVSFVSACCLMMRLQIEFMALIFVVVYVGAIAVLFLFVVMMLNLNSMTQEKSHSIGNHSPELNTVVSSGIGRLVLGTLWEGSLRFQYPLAGKEGISGEWEKEISYVQWVERLDAFSSVETMGQVLYTSKVIYLIMAGFVLLVARVGAIVLTLQVRHFARAKRQQVYQQRSRDSSRALMMTRVM